MPQEIEKGVALRRVSVLTENFVAQTVAACAARSLVSLCGKRENFATFGDRIRHA